MLIEELEQDKFDLYQVVLDVDIAIMMKAI